MSHDSSQQTYFQKDCRRCFHCQRSVCPGAHVSSCTNFLCRERNCSTVASCTPKRASPQMVSPLVEWASCPEDGLKLDVHVGVDDGFDAMGPGLWGQPFCPWSCCQHCYAVYLLRHCRCCQRLSSLSSQRNSFISFVQSQLLVSKVKLVDCDQK